MFFPFATSALRWSTRLTRTDDFDLMMMSNYTSYSSSYTTWVKWTKKKFICEKCTLCSVCIYQTKKCLILELNLNLTVNTSFAICAFVLPNISPIKKIRKSLSLQTTSIYSIIFLTSFGISLLASFSQRFFFKFQTIIGRHWKIVRQFELKFPSSRSSVWMYHTLNVSRDIKVNDQN